MTQALHTAIESLTALSLEEKHQLWLILDEAIAQAEENDWLKTIRQHQKFKRYVKSIKVVNTSYLASILFKSSYDLCNYRH